MAIDPELVGRWQTTSMEQRYDDGRVVVPFGKDLEGFLQYSADGYMCGLMQRSGRTPFTSGGQWTASDEEKARAYDNFLTYSGRWEVKPDNLLLHHIEISLFPNWIGATQSRVYKLMGDELEITARIEPEAPMALTSYLAFRRVGP